MVNNGGESHTINTITCSFEVHAGGWYRPHHGIIHQLPPQQATHLPPVPSPTCQLHLSNCPALCMHPNVSCGALQQLQCTLSQMQHLHEKETSSRTRICQYVSRPSTPRQPPLGSAWPHLYKAFVGSTKLRLAPSMFNRHGPDGQDSVSRSHDPLLCGVCVCMFGVRNAVASSQCRLSPQHNTLYYVFSLSLFLLTRVYSNRVQMVHATKLMGEI